MDALHAFIIPVCGLLWSVIGAWNLLRTISHQNPHHVTQAQSGSPEAVTAGRHRHRQRLNGIAWFCLGIAILWFFKIRVSAFSLLGLLCVVSGTWRFLATFRRGGQEVLGSRSELQSSQGSTVKTTTKTPQELLRRRRISGVFWLSAGIVTLCFSGIRTGAAPTAVSLRRDEDDRLAQIVTQHVQRDFAEHDRIGLVVGAVINEEEILLGFGKRRLGDSQPPDADTVFEIGSVTKVFTGIMLARRVESGALQLDDRIADHLPRGWSLPAAAHEITLSHCTTHTSGLPRLPANIGFVNLARALFGGDPYRDYSEDQFRAVLETVELEFEPGAELRYSNFAVGLLGFVLAEQNGSDYESLVNSEICQPLGMQRTAMTRKKWHLDNMPAKYRATLNLGPALVALTSSDWQLPNHLAGAGGLRSTGRDMMLFLKANMGLIPTDFDAAIRRSHQELYQEGNARAVGMNWMRSFESDISQNIIWHNGGTGGFRSYLGFTEDRQVGVFVLSNTALGVDDLAKRMITALARTRASTL